MVDDRVTFFTYLPLAAAGLTRSSSSTTARKLVARSSTGKLALPIGTCTTPLLRAVVRYSTLPPLKSLTALATSVVTVPVFGLGMRPRRPRTRSAQTIGARSTRRRPAAALTGPDSLRSDNRCSLDPPPPCGGTHRPGLAPLEQLTQSVHTIPTGAPGMRWSPPGVGCFS